jgi:hypothetical protein
MFYDFPPGKNTVVFFYFSLTGDYAAIKSSCSLSNSSRIDAGKTFLSLTTLMLKLS